MKLCIAAEGFTRTLIVVTAATLRKTADIPANPIKTLKTPHAFDCAATGRPMQGPASDRRLIALLHHALPAARCRTVPPTASVLSTTSYQ
jgi:hypothetical protein